MPALLTGDQQQVMQDSLASADNGNVGIGRSEAIELVKEIAGGNISTKSATNHLDRTLRRKGHEKGILNLHLSPHRKQRQREV